MSYGEPYIIVEQTATQVVLGRDYTDDHRLVITPDEDGDDQIMRIYPCATCGWEDTCEKGCHT